MRVLTLPGLAIIILRIKWLFVSNKKRIINENVNDNEDINVNEDVYVNEDDNVNENMLMKMLMSYYYLTNQMIICI